MEKNVQTWFDALTDEQAPLLTELRQLVLASDENIVEAIKWGQPCYSLNCLFCYLKKAKTHVVLGFQQGAHLDDPYNFLEGTGKDMRHIKIQLKGVIKSRPFSALLKEAIKYDSIRQ